MTGVETSKTPAVLSIQDLRVHFRADGAMVRSVDGVSLEVSAGETVCIVGESGSGKTVTAHSVMRLIPTPPGRFVGGRILWKGEDVVQMSAARLGRMRAKEVGIIFQEPMTSLNPVYTVGDQIAESVCLHEGVSKRIGLNRAVEMLELVRIPNARRRVSEYPHQFSGGMRQRVMIAMALACRPQLLIADEPTTALDVTIQSQILELLQDLKAQMGMALLLITHAMGVVAEMAQRVVVMYAGRVVEEGSVEQVFANPQHPYTRGLIRCIPRIDGTAGSKLHLPTIAGVVPNLALAQEGCGYAGRCTSASAVCRTVVPNLIAHEPGHRAACVLVESGAGHIAAAPKF